MTTESNTGIGRGVAIALVVLAALLILPMFAGGMWGWGPGMMGGYGRFGNVPGWMAAVGLLMPLVWLVVLGGGAYFVYRAVAGNGERDRAMDELRTAYARGELTDEEYEQRRAVLDRDRNKG